MEMLFKYLSRNDGRRGSVQPNNSVDMTMEGLLKI